VVTFSKFLKVKPWQAQRLKMVLFSFICFAAYLYIFRLGWVNFLAVFLKTFTTNCTFCSIIRFDPSYWICTVLCTVLTGSNITVLQDKYTLFKHAYFYLLVTIFQNLLFTCTHSLSLLYFYTYTAHIKSYTFLHWSK